MYVLGRTFLQEIYVVVDYVRNNFSLSQAYPEGGSSRIIPILAPPNSTANNTTATPVLSNNRSGSPSLPTKAWAGIGVGIAFVVLTTIGLLIAWRKKWGPFRASAPKQPQERIEKAEMHGESKPWVEIMSKQRAELDATDASQEIAGSDVPVVELEGSTVHHEP